MTSAEVRGMVPWPEAMFSEDADPRAIHMALLLYGNVWVARRHLLTGGFMDFEEWLEKDREAFADEVEADDFTVSQVINRDMARRDFDHNRDPMLAGREAARFAFFGE